jgi:hypothetical protein
VLVNVGNVDVPCSNFVGHFGDRADERRVLDETHDEDVLPFGDIGADFHGKLGKCAEAVAIHAETLPAPVLATSRLQQGKASVSGVHGRA